MLSSGGPADTQSHRGDGDDREPRQRVAVAAAAATVVHLTLTLNLHTSEYWHRTTRPQAMIRYADGYVGSRM